MQNPAGVTEHLRGHQKYPATKGELVAECDKLSEFSAEDKSEFASKLSERTYSSADEVIRALGL